MNIFFKHNAVKSVAVKDDVVKDDVVKDDIVKDVIVKDDVVKDVIVSASNDILPAADAVINVSVDNSELKAYVYIEPPRNGGSAPTFEALKTALSSKAVSYNINMEKLKELEMEPVYNSHIVVATGIAPVNGIDGTASFQINTEKKSLRPKENKDGTVDLHDLGLVENVKQGQVLCMITLHTEGTPGISVKGKEIKQKKGMPVPSYLGKNTELNEDGSAILAKINGQVEFDGNKINVNDSFCVRGNVGNNTGDIKVLSNLVVCGMVLPGFKIEAGGDIDVNDRVEAATIKAGGNVKLKSGITGSELYCEGDLKSRFIENCNVFVKGSIEAEYILNSNIKCGKDLKIIGMMAKIIGGSCVVGQNIEAHTIGSAAGIKTRLELGTNPAIIERQQDLLAQIPNLEKQTQRLTPLITALRQLEANNQLTAEKKEILDNIGGSYDTNVELLEEMKKELNEIAQSVYIKGYGQVICTGTIYPGTRIVIGEASLSVSDTLNNTLLYYEDGRVCQGTAR